MSPRTMLRVALCIIAASIFLYSLFASRRQEPKDTQKFCSSPEHGFYLPCEWVPQETEA